MFLNVCSQRASYRSLIFTDCVAECLWPKSIACSRWPPLPSSHELKQIVYQCCMCNNGVHAFGYKQVKEASRPLYICMLNRSKLNRS